MLFDLFGIHVTWGHFILMAVGIVLYDAIWTFAFSNKASEWWFERIQGLLKIGIYAGFVGFVVLVSYMPLPWNLVLVLAAAASTVSIVFWTKKRPAKTGSLSIVITGLNSRNANATISGPDYSHTLAKSATLSGLVPGQYVVAATDIVISGKPPKTLKATVTTSPVAVYAGKVAKVTIAYS